MLPGLIRDSVEDGWVKMAPRAAHANTKDIDMLKEVPEEKILLFL